jgi:predicted transcriptional regulator
MRSATVRISAKARQMLRELAAQSGESMQEILDKAIDHYQREQFWKEANASFAALRQDAEAWQHELAERALWDNTLMDGIEPEREEKPTKRVSTPKPRRKRRA